MSIISIDIPSADNGSFLFYCRFLVSSFLQSGIFLFE